MRILLLVQYYPPQIQSCGKLMQDLGRALHDEGHEVLIVAPDAALDVGHSVNHEHGLTVLRVRGGRFREVSKPRRAWNEWRLSSAMWSRAGDFFRENPCDLIVNYSPTILFAPLVRRLKKLWGCPNYLVLRDVFPQWNVDAGLIRENGPAHRFFRFYERILYDNADIIGVQSPRNLDYFVNGLSPGSPRSIENRDLEVLFNWVPSRNQETKASSRRRELGLDDRVVFFYGGNLGKAQEPSALLDLAEDLRDEPEAFFLVVGDGSEEGSLRERARALDLENILFLPPVDQATYLGMVAECDVGLVVLNPHLRTHNFPGKLLDYVYCSTPVLAAINRGNDLEDLLLQHEAGLVSWSGARADTAANALRLVREPELRSRLGAGARGMLESLFGTQQATRQILAAHARVSSPDSSSEPRVGG